MRIKQLLVATWVTIRLLSATTAHAQNHNTIMVQVNKPDAEVQPTMRGVFFEDIDLGADGGIFAELVKNRAFEFCQPLMG